MIVAALITMLGGAMWLNRPRPEPASTPAPSRVVPPEGHGVIEGTGARELGVAQPPTAAAQTATAEEVRRPIASSPSTAPASSPTSLEEMISRAIPGVVLVETTAGRGTAFFVEPDTLLTNAHVVAGNSSVTIRHAGGATASARVAAASPNFDIAVLKISSPEPSQRTIPLGSALDARVGQEAIAIGSALGTLQNTVTRGIVSAVRQSGGITLVQTDAAVNPGNSGGPLLDRNGTAIGITTMGYAERQGLNFAVAIDHARALLEGRATPTLAPTTPIANLGLLPPQPSPADQARVNGAQTFEQVVAQLARRADAIDDRWRSFRRACYEGRVVGSFDREWYALFDQRAMQGAVAPGCGMAFADLQRLARDVGDAVVAADEKARQADVYPGIRRELLRKYRLDYTGWSR